MRHLKSNAMTALFVLLASQNSFAAEAEEQLVKTDEINRGEVIITTRKREENVMDVGVAMSVFTSEDLDDAGITNIADIANLTPGLTFSPLFGGSAATPVIRGLSTTIGEPNVGFFIDGVYQSSRALMESMLGNNIERIEVAKGPQSALYGRNTFGGAINFITKAPSDDAQGVVKLGVGNFNSRDFSITHTGPIGDINYRVWLNHSSRDGYYDNELTGGELDDRSTNTYGFNLSGGERDDFNWTLTLGLDNTSDGTEPLTQIENVGNFFAVLNDHQLFVGEVPGFTEGYAVTPGHEDRDNLSSSLKLNWSFNEMSLTSITGLNNLENDVLVDDDYESREIHQTATRIDQQEISQEFRLQSENDSDIEWTVGVYFYDLDLDTDITSEFLGALAPFGAVNSITNETTEEFALFGSVNWQLNDNWNLIFSGRYFQEEKSATATDIDINTSTSATFSDSADFNDFTPRIDVEFHPEAGGLFYASIAKAVKAGGFNVVTISGGIAPDERSYDSETSLNYEVGYKNSYMDNKVAFTAALFSIDWKDQIVRALGATNAVLNENAGETSSQGIELELNANPTDNLTIRAGLAYTDATYDSYTFGALAGLGINPLLDGTELQFVSEWQSNISFQYRGGQFWEDFSWFTRFDAAYQSDQSITQNADARVPARTIANFRFGVENIDWRIYFWANNAFDDDTAITGVIIPANSATADFFTGQRPGLQVFQPLINAPNPRTLGITAYYNF